MLGQSDALDIALAVLGVLREALDKRSDPAARRGIFQYGYQLVKKLGVGRRKDDLRAAASATGTAAAAPSAINQRTWATADS